MTKTSHTYLSRAGTKQNSTSLSHCTCADKVKMIYSPFTSDTQNCQILNADSLQLNMLTKENALEYTSSEIIDDRRHSFTYCALRVHWLPSHMKTKFFESRFLLMDPVEGGERGPKVIVDFQKEQWISALWTSLCQRSLLLWQRCLQIQYSISSAIWLPSHNAILKPEMSCGSNY
jgi:hypothetical protein